MGVSWLLTPITLERVKALLIVIKVVAIAENKGTTPNLNCGRSEVCFACELIFKV